MNVSFGSGKTEYGPGVQIELTGNEVAMAIYTYLMAHNIIIDGPATIKINGALIKKGSMYIDPSGYVIANGQGWSGKGHNF